MFSLKKASQHIDRRAVSYLFDKVTQIKAVLGVTHYKESDDLFIK